MHLIFGGAYQGKLAFAQKHYDFSQTQICSCTQESIDFSLPCIIHIEEYVYGCVMRQEDPLLTFQQNRQKWEGSVLILQDISGGIVPTEKQDRAWREATGRLCQYLAREAASVSRIFCGLEARLK